MVEEEESSRQIMTRDQILSNLRSLDNKLEMEAIVYLSSNIQLLNDTQITSAVLALLHRAPKTIQRAETIVVFKAIIDQKLTIGDARRAAEILINLGTILIRYDTVQEFNELAKAYTTVVVSRSSPNAVSSQSSGSTFGGIVDNRVPDQQMHKTLEFVLRDQRNDEWREEQRRQAARKSPISRPSGRYKKR